MKLDEISQSYLAILELITNDWQGSQLASYTTEYGIKWILPFTISIQAIGQTGHQQGSW